MTQKLFQTIFIVLFFIIFSVFFFGDYSAFHKNNKALELKKADLIKSIDDFSLEDIKEINSIEIEATPDLKVLDKIVDKINSSKERVFVEVYMLTQKRIIDALIKAKKRNIDVKVILEKNPYKSPRLNEKAYNSLESTGVDVTWSNPENYSLNHSKFLLIDDEIIISTGNLSHSTFVTNRDLFLFIEDEPLLSSFENIFSYDYDGVKSSPYNGNLVLSPDYSRKKLTDLISGAKEEVKLYFPYLKDNKLEQVLIDKAKSGVSILIIVSSNYYNDYYNKIKSLEGNNIKINEINKNKMHSKSILVDREYLFIGSVNFSTYSLDKNREVGLIIKNKSIVEDFLKLWK